jgi:hypothetical protein
VLCIHVHFTIIRFQGVQVKLNHTRARYAQTGSCSLHCVMWLTACCSEFGNDVELSCLTCHEQITQDCSKFGSGYFVCRAGHIHDCVRLRNMAV